MHVTERLRLTLGKAIMLFEVQLAADGKSEHTRGAYLRDLRHFKEWLRADPDTLSITPAILARYVASGFPATKPAISANRTKTALRVFFQFLTDAGYIDTNPARLIKNGRTEPKIPSHLTTAEARRLMCVVPGERQPGCRAGSRATRLLAPDRHEAGVGNRAEGKRYQLRPAERADQWQGRHQTIRLPHVENPQASEVVHPGLGSCCGRPSLPRS